MNMDRKRYLNWFLAFLRTDLDDLKIVQFKKLAADTISHLRLSEAGILRNESVYELERTKGMVDDFVLSLWEEFDYERTEEVIGYDLQTLQRRLKEKTDPFFTSLSSSEGINIQKPAPIKTESILKVRDGVFQSYEMKRGDPADMLFSEFIHCLDGLSLDVFSRCLLCKSWYAKLTKKEKNFCSDKCSSLAGVRKNRKERKDDPVRSKKYKEAEAIRSQKNRDALRQALGSDG
jgi:hypothetical protein